MIRKKFFAEINLNLNDYKKLNAYIHFVKGSEPTSVIFLSINDKYLNFCNVYDLKTDTEINVNLTSLIPFSLTKYKFKLKEWKINYHKTVLKKLKNN